MAMFCFVFLLTSAVVVICWRWYPQHEHITMSLCAVQWSGRLVIGVENFSTYRTSFCALDHKQVVVH